MAGVLVALLTLVLAACGGSGTGGSGNPDLSTPDLTTPAPLESM